MVKEITPENLGALMGEPGACLVDIRKREVYDREHIPGAVHLDRHALEGFIRSTDKNVPVVCCCYHGNSSIPVTRFLEEAGFRRAFSLKGGFAGWKQTRQG